VPVEGAFSRIMPELAEALTAAKTSLGLKRVTLGTIAPGYDMPEVFVAAADGDDARAEDDGGNQKPATLWAFPVNVLLLAEYPEFDPAGQKPVEAALVLAEKVADVVLANPCVGGARGVRFLSFAIEEGLGESKTPTVGVELRFSYRLTLSR